MFVFSPMIVDTLCSKPVEMLGESSFAGRSSEQVALSANSPFQQQEHRNNYCLWWDKIYELKVIWSCFCWYPHAHSLEFLDCFAFS